MCVCECSIYSAYSGGRVEMGGTKGGTSGGDDDPQRRGFPPSSHVRYRTYT